MIEIALLSLIVHRRRLTQKLSRPNLSAQKAITQGPRLTCRRRTLLGELKARILAMH